MKGRPNYIGYLFRFCWSNLLHSLLTSLFADARAPIAFSLFS